MATGRQRAGDGDEVEVLLISLFSAFLIFVTRGDASILLAEDHYG